MSKTYTVIIPDDAISVVADPAFEDVFKEQLAQALDEEVKRVADDMLWKSYYGEPSAPHVGLLANEEKPRSQPSYKWRTRLALKRNVK